MPLSDARLKIKTKRVYEEPSSRDGFRVLVDRLWPRGVSREDAELDLWLKDIAPSDGLRKWFGHDPERWREFRKRYSAELTDRDELVEQLLASAGNREITLLYGARDEKHNQAVVLREYLLKRRRK